jgi:VIT1/CCC1 family predicted Fe2+/Mn2+ transporter
MHPIVGTERKTWYARLWGALDPVEVLTELTSGLTITLVVVLTAGVVLQDDDNPVRVLLVLAIGSTLAAGVSAGILNALEDLHEAGDRTSWRARLRALPRQQANALVEQQIEAVTGSELEPEDVARIAAAIVDQTPGAEDRPPRIRSGNVRTAVVTVAYNLAALIPAALPFLILDDWHMAWRVSTAMVAAVLVVVGTVWGRVAGISPLTCGLVLASVGFVEIVAAFVLEAL